MVVGPVLDHENRSVGLIAYVSLNQEAGTLDTEQG